MADMHKLQTQLGDYDVELYRLLIETTHTFFIFLLYIHCFASTYCFASTKIYNKKSLAQSSHNVGDTKQRRYWANFYLYPQRSGG